MILTADHGAIQPVAASAVGVSANQVLARGRAALHIHLVAFAVDPVLEVQQSLDGGASWIPVGSTAAPNNGIIRRVITNPAGLWQVECASLTSGVWAVFYAFGGPKWMEA